MVYPVCRATGVLPNFLRAKALYTETSTPHFVPRVPNTRNPIPGFLVPFLQRYLHSPPWFHFPIMNEQMQLLPQSQLRTVRIEFDGGTPCNIPRLGFGIGYGSYKIDSEPIVRIDHGRPMSCNVAEIETLICAISDVTERFEPSCTVLNIHGDSQTALHRCIHPMKPKHRRLNTCYGQSAQRLWSLCGRFQNVSIHWRGRSVSVKLFGH